MAPRLVPNVHISKAAWLPIACHYRVVYVTPWNLLVDAHTGDMMMAGLVVSGAQVGAVLRLLLAGHSPSPIDCCSPQQRLLLPTGAHAAPFRVLIAGWLINLLGFPMPEGV